MGADSDHVYANRGPRLGAEVEARAVEQLRADLADGSWADRYADLLTRGTADVAARLVVA